MFVGAIEKAAQFTRPIHSITRNYGSTSIHPISASLFFINPDGWALTCKHVTELVISADLVNRRYRQFHREAQDLIVRKRKTAVKDLEKKYGYSEKITVQIKNTFVNCCEGKLDFKAFPHKSLDLALIKFSGGKVLCERFPIFPKDTSALKPGRSLCRLGYPFPEFTNYRYDEDRDDIVWTTEGRIQTALFPIDGILTRMILQNGNGPEVASSFEMSTPGLRGQSGGPVFDTDGKVWGVQFATGHLYLGFDIHQEVFKHGKLADVSDSAFLHVGHCLHIDRVKEFLREHAVSFQEE